MNFSFRLSNHALPDVASAAEILRALRTEHPDVSGLPLPDASQWTNLGCWHGDPTAAPMDEEGVPEANPWDTPLTAAQQQDEGLYQAQVRNWHNKFAPLKVIIRDFLYIGLVIEKLQLITVSPYRYLDVFPSPWYDELQYSSRISAKEKEYHYTYAMEVRQRLADSGMPAEYLTKICPLSWLVHIVAQRPGPPAHRTALIDAKIRLRTGQQLDSIGDPSGPDVQLGVQTANRAGGAPAPPQPSQPVIKEEWHDPPKVEVDLDAAAYMWSADETVNIKQYHEESISLGMTKDAADALARPLIARHQATFQQRGTVNELLQHGSYPVSGDRASPGALYASLLSNLEERDRLSLFVVLPDDTYAASAYFAEEAARNGYKSANELLRNVALKAPTFARDGSGADQYDDPAKSNGPFACSFAFTQRFGTTALDDDRHSFELCIGGGDLVDSAEQLLDVLGGICRSKEERPNLVFLMMTSMVLTCSMSDVIYRIFTGDVSAPPADLPVNPAMTFFSMPLRSRDTYGVVGMELMGGSGGWSQPMMSPPGNLPTQWSNAGASVFQGQTATETGIFAPGVGGPESQAGAGLLGLSAAGVWPATGPAGAGAVAAPVFATPVLNVAGPPVRLGGGFGLGIGGVWGMSWGRGGGGGVGGGGGLRRPFGMDHVTWSVKVALVFLAAAAAAAAEVRPSSCLSPLLSAARQHFQSTCGSLEATL